MKTDILTTAADSFTGMPVDTPAENDAGNVFADGSNDFADEEKARRRAQMKAAAKTLFRTDISKMDDAAVAGFYTACARGLFGIEDPDGRVAFGRRAGDARANVGLLRDFCNGNYSVIRDPEYDKWAAMDEERKFRYALEHEGAAAKTKGWLAGNRGATLKELAGAGMPGAQFGNVFQNMAAPNRDETVRRVKYENLTPEEQQVYRDDVIGRFEDKLSKRQVLATYLAATEGLSDRAAMLLANTYNGLQKQDRDNPYFHDKGTVDVDAVEALPDDEKDRFYTALAIMRGDRKKGHLLFIPTDFSDDTALNRAQLALYGLQTSVLDLFSDTYAMGRDAARWTYAKTVMGDEARKNYFRRWDAEQRAQRALEQGLPEADSWIGEMVQSLGENSHWFIPYGAIAKGGGLVKAGKAAKATAALRGEVAGIQKAAAQAGAAASGASLGEVGRAAARSGMMTGPGVDLWKRQMAAVEHFTQELRAAGDAARKADAMRKSGRALWTAGQASAFSAFSEEYIANCDAAGISREESVPMSAIVGLVNAKVEQLYVPGLESSLTPVQVKSLMLASGLRAFRSEGAAGFRKWAANYVAKGVSEGVKVTLSEGAVEEPIQQLVTEWGKEIAKSADELREKGWGGIALAWGKFIHDNFAADGGFENFVRNGLGTYVDTAVDMVPSSVGFGLTTNFNAKMGQRRRNRARRRENLKKWEAAKQYALANGREEPVLPRMLSHDASGRVVFNPDGVDYDEGVADVVARAMETRNAIGAYWESKGDTDARAGNRLVQAVTDARAIWRDGDGDKLGRIAETVGVDQKTAEVVCQYLEAESEAEAYSPNVRAWTSINLSSADISEDTIRSVLPGYVDGSFMADAEGGTYAARVRLADGTERTIAYRVGDISAELVADVAENEKEDSAFGRSYDARMKQGAEGAARTWASLSDAERHRIAVDAAARVNGFSSGRAGVLEMKDADGRTVRVNADDVIYLASGRLADVGYSAMAHMGTARHETFHALWRFAATSYTDVQLQEMARTLGVDTASDTWRVDLDEAMAHQMEEYASGHYVTHVAETQLGKLLDSGAAKFIDVLSRFGLGDEVVNAKTGRPFALADFYDAVLRGEIGSGATGVEHVATEAHAPKAESSAAKGAGVPMEVSEEDRAAVSADLTAAQAAEQETAAENAPAAPVNAEAAPMNAEAAPAKAAPKAGGSLDNPADASVTDARFYRIGAGEGVDIVGELVVSDARDLKTSYKGTLEDASLQNRGETEEGRALVEKIAARPDPLQVGTVQPRANNGFIWATPSGNVFIGNTRESGITKAYERGNAENVRAYMLAEAQRRGLEVPEGCGQPVVHFVLRRIESADGSATIQDVVRMTNESVNRGMNVYETARNDADVLVANNLVPGIALRPDGLVDTDRSADAIGSFRRLTNAQGMIDENTGMLTEEGQTRLSNAVLAALMGNGNADLLRKIVSESARLDIENEKRALMRCAAELMDLAAKKPEFDLRQPLAEALRYYVEWRDADETRRAEAGKSRHDWYARTKDGARRRGLAWADHMAQQDMFRTPSADAKLLGDLLAASRDLRSFEADDRETEAGKQRAQRMVADYIGDYVRNARAVNTETVDMFGTPPASRTDVLEAQRTRDGSKRFSFVGTRQDGIEVYSTRSVDGMTNAERMAEFLRKLKEDYKGRTARFTVGGKTYYATFGGDDAGKIVYGDKKTSTRNKKVKNRIGASGDIFDLVENSRHKKAKKEEGKTTDAHRNVEGWDYFEKTVQVDDGVYDVRIEVRRKPSITGQLKDEFVYNVFLNHSKKKADLSFLRQTASNGGAAVRDVDAPALRLEKSANGIVSQSSGNGNRKFSISGIYTGSSADYEKPSLQYIGTGEGSQVYGWGLYGSNQRGVAESYATVDADEKGTLYNTRTGEVRAKKGDWDFAYDKGVLDLQGKVRKEAAEQGWVRSTKGNIYEQTFFTNRAPGDESHLLSWYEPVSEENLERILEGLKKEGVSDRFKDMYWLRYKGMSSYLESNDIKGALLDNGSTGDAVYQQLTSIIGSPKEASEFLARADIDGVKYPVDSYGKQVKDGEEAGWNYVSFRDDNINVDHKWVDGQRRFSIAERHDELMRSSAEYRDVYDRYHDADGSAKPGWLKAPNGRDTNLEPYQWVQVRTPSFTEWFGDWMAAAEMAPSSMDDAKVHFKRLMASKAELRTADGNVLRFASQSAKAYSKAAEVESANRQAHWCAIANIEQFVVRSRFMYEEKPRNGSSDILSYVKYGCVFTFGGDRYLAKITSKKYPGREQQNFYTVESVSVKKIVARGIHEAISKGQPLDANDESRIARILEGVNADSSKIVDENGEPLVVYRGASFDPLAQEPGKGVIRPESYFTADPEYAKRYGDVRAYYLRITKPFDVRNAEDAKRLAEFYPAGYQFATGHNGALDWGEMANFELDELREKYPEYDGIVMDEGGDPLPDGSVKYRGVSYVPFDGGAQVKSATDNNGDFSRNNDDVRYSIAGIYTGSAADYEKPSLQYIGTGEGSQVYGWGLYGSNRRGVAETYASMSARPEVVVVDGKEMRPNEWATHPKGSPEWIALGAVEFGGRNFNKERSIEEILNSDFYAEFTQEQRNAAIEYLRSHEFGRKKMSEKIYEQTFFTNRKPGDESHLLKWYEPVSDEQLGWIRRQAKKEGLDWKKIKGLYQGEEDKSARMLYRAIESVIAGGPNGNNWLGAAKAASEFLARAGIDGVKYPVDSYGKQVKDGEEAGWNYVSFRDDNINVDHKWVDGQRRFSVVADVNTAAALDPDAVDLARFSHATRDTFPRFSVTVPEGPYPTERLDGELKRISGKRMTNDATGMVAVVNSVQRRKIESNAAVRKSESNGFTRDEHNAVASLIEPLWRCAEPASSHPDGNGAPGVSIHRFVSLAYLGEREVFPYLTLKQLNQDDSRIYSVELEKIETLEGTLKDRGLSSSSVEEIVSKLRNKFNAGQAALRRFSLDLMRARASAPENAAKAKTPEGERAEVRGRGRFSFEFPRLDTMSDDELIAAAVATRIALGKSDKASERAVKITTVQKMMKSVHPGWDARKIAVESQRVVQGAQKMARQIRADLDRGVSESLVLEHLPDAMRRQFGAEMRQQARQGARLGTYHQRAATAVEERQARIVEEAVKVQSGVETKLLENAYGVDLSQTLMNLVENPFLKKDKDGNYVPAGAGKQAAEDVTGVVQEDAPQKEVEEHVRRAVDEVVKVSAKKRAEEERARRNRENAAGHDAEVEAAMAAGSGEDGEASLTGADVVDIAARREGINLEDPRQLAHFVVELSRRYWIDSHGLKNDANVWADAVALQFLRKTAANVYGKLAADIAYSQARATAARAIDGFENVPTVQGLLSEMTYVGQVINAKKIRETQQQLCEKLDLFLREKLGAQGRFKPDNEELHRKVSAEVELRARYMRHAMWLTPDAAAEEAKEIQREIDIAATDFEGEGHDVDQSRVMVEGIRKLNVLREFGALRYKPVGKIEEAIAYWEDMERGSGEEIAREALDREVRTKKAAAVLARAFHDTARKYVREGRDLGAMLGDYMQSHMGFMNLLRDMTRYASDADAQAAEKVFRWLELEIQKAGTAASVEKRRHADALAQAVKQIYGRDFAKVLSEFADEDARFAPFMGTVDGQRVRPTKGRAIQLMVSLLQVGRKIEVEDPEKPGEFIVQWEGGYHDNIVKFHREAQAAQIAALLTPADLNLVKWLGQWYESNRQELSGVCESLFGIGVYAETSNYFPVKMLLEKQGLEKGDAVGWSIFPRALTPRVKNERDFDTSADVLQMFMSRMEEGAQWKAHARLGLEMRGIFGRAELQAAIAASHGNKANATVLGFVTDTLAGHGTYDRGDNGATYYTDIVRGWAALGALGANVGVMVRQPTSIPAFGFEIGLAKTAKHMLTAFTPDGMDAMRRIFDSDQRKVRWDTGNTEAVKNALASSGSGMMMRLWKASMITNKLGDVVPALVVGQGIYRECLEKGMSEEDAMAYTWMLVERTQQSSRIENQAQFQRRSKYGRAIYQFLSTQQQYLQYELRAVRAVMAKPGDASRWARLAGTVTLNHFILSSAYFWVGAMYRRLLGQEPPEDELKDWTVSMLLGPFGALYGLGLTCTGALNEWIKGPQYGGSSSLPFLSYVGNVIVRDPAAVVKAMLDEDASWDDVLEELGKWAADQNALFRDMRKIKKNYFDKD